MSVLKFYLWVFAGVVFSSILVLYSLVIIYDESLIKTPIQKSILAKDVKAKNIELLDGLDVLGDWESNKNLSEYYKFVEENYVYDSDFNCEYWSLNWALYLDKHNINYKFINTLNHIFVMAFYETGYIILDGKTMFSMLE